MLCVEWTDAFVMLVHLLSMSVALARVVKVKTERESEGQADKESPVCRARRAWYLLMCVYDNRDTPGHRVQY